jgi:lysozyme family protein
MASWTYDEALRRLLTHEGGYTHHPADPGGPTNFGITQADFRKYVKGDATADDIRAMKLADAKAIYRAKYWEALACDELPAGLDYAVFDYGVNSGIARAARVLRSLLGLSAGAKVDPDAVAAAKAREAGPLIRAVCAERLAFLRRLKTWPVFGKGWERRVREVEAAALSMAAASSAQKAEAKSAPAKTARNKRPAEIGRAAAGGVVIAGAAAAGQAHAVAPMPGSCSPPLPSSPDSQLAPFCSGAGIRAGRRTTRRCDDSARTSAFASVPLAACGRLFLSSSRRQPRR